MSRHGERRGDRTSEEEEEGSDEEQRARNNEGGGRNDQSRGRRRPRDDEDDVEEEARLRKKARVAEVDPVALASFKNRLKTKDTRLKYGATHAKSRIAVLFRLGYLWLHETELAAIVRLVLNEAKLPDDTIALIMATEDLLRPFRTLALAEIKELRRTAVDVVKVIISQLMTLPPMGTTVLAWRTTHNIANDPRAATRASGKPAATHLALLCRPITLYDDKGEVVKNADGSIKEFSMLDVHIQWWLVMEGHVGMTGEPLKKVLSDYSRAPYFEHDKSMVKTMVIHFLSDDVLLKDNDKETLDNLRQRMAQARTPPAPAPPRIAGAGAKLKRVRNPLASLDSLSGGAAGNA